MTAASPPDTLALARRIVDLIREKRGTDVVLLDVRALVDYTDFFLLATGQSGRQNQAIGEHVVKTLKADHRYAISKSGLDTGSWICLDMGDVVVHVFDAETRARYDLELLWADAPREEVGAEPLAADATPAGRSPAGTAAPDEDLAPAAAEKPKRRKRVARKAAVEDADAENAPDSERPPIDEPEPDDGSEPAAVEDEPSPAKATKRPAAKKPVAPRKEKAPAPKSYGKHPKKVAAKAPPKSVPKTFAKASPKVAAKRPAPYKRARRRP